MDPLLPFHAKFQVSDKELVLTYEVENRSRRDAYMLDRLQRGNYYRADPNDVYLHLERDTKTVWLNKRIPAFPKGQHPDPPVFPFSTPLRAGAKVREEIHVPLPIREWRQYAQRPKGERRVEYRNVYFTLQYCWRPEGMTEEIAEADGHKVVYTHLGATPFQPGDFGFLETEHVALRLPVLEGELIE